MSQLLAYNLPLLAHAFGQTYNLPVPLWLFLFGGAATVIVSFVLASLLVDVKNSLYDYPKRLIKILPPKGLQIVSTVAVIVYFFTIVAGVIGDQRFTHNITPTLFWVVLLVGLAHLSVLVGNIWPFINPFWQIINWIESFAGKQFRPYRLYPERLRYLPALASYVVLAWIELLSYGWGIVPLNLASLLAIYGLTTTIGVVLYGKAAWFRYGDFFSVFFSLFGRIAIFEYNDNKVYLRPPFVGLLVGAKKSSIFLFFVLFMLSSTAFDGLKETTAYSSVTDWLARWPLVSNLDSRAIDTILLLAFPLAFFAAYWFCLWTMKQIVKTKYSVMDLASRFSLALIPIAIAYSVAHYFTVLVIQGQLMIQLISDPLGLGWNLFHTATYSINAGIINAATVWYIQLTLIIFGHVAAVYLAHITALRTFVTGQRVLTSQYPMLALMVVYTITSLWIISQAIVSTSN